MTGKVQIDDGDGDASSVSWMYYFQGPGKF